MPKVDNEQFAQLSQNSDIKNAGAQDFDDSGLPKKFKLFIVNSLQLDLFRNQKTFDIKPTEQFNLDNEALDIMT